MTLGLPRGMVSLSPYSDDWAELFEEEKARIAGCLAGKAFELEHVGSTAIPGLPAKPILDIALGIPALKDYEEYVERLCRVGYEYRGERPGDGDHILAKGPEDGRTHYLHLVVLGGTPWRDYLVFRDTLRQHQETCDAYAELKQRLAAGHTADRAAYTEGKQAFIERVLNQAHEEPADCI